MHKFHQKRFLKLLSLLSGYLFSVSAAAQPNAMCNGMTPICTDPGIVFTANTGVSIETGNDYGCLFSQPNPTWYYFEIENPGDIHMELYAPSDIDFIIYGPFSSLAVAYSYCGSMGVSTSAPEVDCSYSGTNHEFPSVTGAQTGEFYVLLITNYASIVQEITLTQVGGTGTTLCDAVYEACADAGTYTVARNGVTITDPLTLYQDDQLDLFSNTDYILPAETVAQPQGDGIYSAQILWLIYNSTPVSNNPLTDPGFTFEIIPGDSLTDINNSASNIIQNWGCGGTYWFVPVTADDGIGGNNNMADGTTDNGGLHWDRNGNGCYELGTPIQITYDCIPGNSPHAGETSLYNSSVNIYTTDGILKITELTENATLYVYDLSGRKLAATTIYPGNSDVKINLPSGNYIYSLIMEDNVITKLLYTTEP